MAKSKGHDKVTNAQRLLEKYKQKELAKQQESDYQEDLARRKKEGYKSLKEDELIALIQDEVYRNGSKTHIYDMCHGIERHENLTDVEMLDAALRNEKNASLYENDGYFLPNQAIYAMAPEIARWVKSDETDTLVMDYTFEDPIGGGFSTSYGTIRKCETNDLNVVMKKDPTNPMGFGVKTFLPEKFPHLRLDDSQRYGTAIAPKGETLTYIQNPKDVNPIRIKNLPFDKELIKETPTYKAATVNGKAMLAFTCSSASSNYRNDGSHGKMTMDYRPSYNPEDDTISIKYDFPGDETSKTIQMAPDGKLSVVGVEPEKSQEMIKSLLTKDKSEIEQGSQLYVLRGLNANSRRIRKEEGHEFTSHEPKQFTGEVAKYMNEPEGKSEGKSEEKLSNPGFGNS